MKIKILISIILFSVGSVGLLHAQERKTDDPLVIHSKNEKSSILNAPTKATVNQTPQYSISDIRKTDMPLINHTKNKESVIVNAIRSETKVSHSPVVKLTPENREKVLKKEKLIEHTKNEESKIFNQKKN